MTNPPTDERGVTDGMVREWAERHDIFNSGSGGHLTDARAAFDDAQSLAALSHQGAVVAVDALQGLLDEWENMNVPHSASSYELGMFDGYRGAHYDLTALISKAEKV